MNTKATLRKILPLTVLFLAGLIFLSCSKNDNIQSVVESIQGAQYTYIAANNLSLPTFDNSRVSLNTYKDKLVFLQVWRSGCHYCQQEAPLNSELYHKYIKTDNNIEIIGISIDSDVAAAKDFIENYNLPYPTMLTRGNNATLDNSGYGISGTPTSFILAPNGIIVAKIVGAYDFKPAKLYTKLKKIYVLAKKVPNTDEQ